jgi:hypothetical protein|tara:strand:- start:4575 stop:4730 length:156 start_codon:yes stop_codon:yes gene_type:complete
MKMIKPSGIEVEVNDNSISFAKNLGWKEAGKKASPKTKAAPKAKASAKKAK